MAVAAAETLQDALDSARQLMSEARRIVEQISHGGNSNIPPQEAPHHDKSAVAKVAAVAVTVREEIQDRQDRWLAK